MSRELLAPSRVLISLSTDRDEVFHDLIERLVDPGARKAMSKVLAAYPDLPFGFLEEDILIPHFRVPGLNRPEAVLALLPGGVQGKKGVIRLVLVLATPEAETALHLRLLQGLSSLLPQIEPEALRSRSPEEALAVLALGEQRSSPWASPRDLRRRRTVF
jgi:sodium/potassium-transporting ATPase subunit alpha